MVQPQKQLTIKCHLNQTQRLTLLTELIKAHRANQLLQ
jgi:hypothetical protein